MRTYILFILLAFSFTFLLADDLEKYVPSRTAIYPDFVSSQDHNTQRPAPEWDFAVLPTNILTSYYDYMIGSLNSLPMKLQPSDQGDCYYLVYQGQRTSSGLRRVFYSYINSVNGAVYINNEITSIPNREGFPAVDIDNVSGKPLFVWHANADTDVQYEVQFAYDAFIEGIAGLIPEPITNINNPLTVSTQTGSTTDNEFIWPSVEIGPSPNLGMRRAYVLARNSIYHASSPSENPIIAWADFNSTMLEEGATLTWNIIHIAEMDNWNTDNVNWRRPFYAFTVGNDGKIYVVGYHTAQNYATSNDLNEPDMDVFACDNYGEGTWQHYSAFSKVPSYNPPTQFGTGPGFFLNADGVPYQDSEIYWTIQDSGHLNAVMDDNGFIHFSALWTLTTIDNAYMPEFNTVKEMVFNTNTHLFDIREVYPTLVSFQDDSGWQPWDEDGNGVVDQYDESSGNPMMKDDWNFCYWDAEACNGAMKFHYNYFRITEVNSQGWMASVWQNTRRSRTYNTQPGSHPELAPFQSVPEIYISVSVDRGMHWSEPIVMNSIETAELQNSTPMWVYPADKIKEVGVTPDGHPIGRLALMYYHDNTWGSASLTPPIGQPNGGSVRFMSIDIEFPVQYHSGIVGEVRRSDNQLPIPNAIITVGPYTATTNPEGGYYLEIPTGSYTVSVSAIGYVSQSVSNIIVPGSNFITQDFNLVPLPVVSVSGVVLAGIPPTAMPNATITLAGVLPYTGTSANNGTFSIPQVLANQLYQVTASAPGFVPYHSTISVLGENYDMGTIILTETTNPPIGLNAVYQANSDMVILQWLTPAVRMNQKMDMKDMQKERWNVTAETAAQRDRNLTGYQIWRFINGQENNESEWILLTTLSSQYHSYIDEGWMNLVAGSYRYAVKAQYSDILLSTPTFSNIISRYTNGILTGTVLDLDDHPIPHATITLTRVVQNGQGPYTVVSPTNGNYSISGVWYGLYYLTVSADGYISPAQRTVTIIANQVIHSNFTLTDSLNAPTNVTATANQEHTQATVLWQAPIVDNLRSFDGYTIWRFPANQEGNPAVWVMLQTNVTSTEYIDNGWDDLDPGLYMYAVRSLYSGNTTSNPSFSNPLMKPVAISDPTVTAAVTRIVSAAPNPFVSSITIRYELKMNCKPTFEIFNISGQRIRTLKNVSSKTGINQITWNGTNDLGEKVSSGLYLYRMTAEGKVYTQKMMLLK